METTKEKLTTFCEGKLRDLGLEDDLHKKRLKRELKDISDQAKYDYFWDFHLKHAKWAKNENNLLVAYLLGFVNDFKIEEEPPFRYGESPDVDVDYPAEIQDYLKSDWAPRTFGSDKVCSIGNYTTFGLKSSLLDMARVHGKDRDEILSLTTRLKLKDDEGAALTWDKAMELYPDLATYCGKNPDVASSAKRLLNRNRGMGKHAGGLIVSRIPIDDLVPLIKGSDGLPVSAWTEGLHSQDLQPVGLIKFDLLVVSDLARIGKCCEMVKRRHNLESICALPGQSDWSDTSYLNNPKSLALANAGQLKGIFQFDSDGIRELCRRGGVTSFTDLAAYNALYRPANLVMKMHERYIERKNGREKYQSHPIVSAITATTYGIYCFQEQIMKVLNVVGDIPLDQCEILRKAISKKKVKEFGKYKEQFIINGQKNLGCTEEEIKYIWSQVEAFSGYGFNKSHSVGYSMIAARLLYLKAYYPLEFFASALSCEKTDEKIKEYKLEAERSNTSVQRIDINKSKVNFEIVENDILIGFSNIKGIGKEVAGEIVSHQPYSSFEDFLTKFGTDTAVVKPLLALGVFGESDRLVFYEFYEFYKKEMKKRSDRQKRNINSRSNIVSDVQAWLGPYRQCTEVEAQEFLDKYKTYEESQFKAELENSGIDLKGAWSFIKKYRKNVDGNAKKVSEDIDISFKSFVPTGVVDEDLKKILTAPVQVAEQMYYGFGWNHILEKSPDFDGGHSFSQFVGDEDLLCAFVECHIIQKPQEKKSKNGNLYYIVRVQDSEWVEQIVTFWSDDYERFKDELNAWEDDEVMKGNLCRMLLKPPGPGFKSFTFYAPMKHLRHKEIPKDKARDDRFLVLRKPTTNE